MSKVSLTIAWQTKTRFFSRKRAQKVPKGSPKDPTGRPKGAQRVQKVDFLRYLSATGAH